MDQERAFYAARTVLPLHGRKRFLRLSREILID